MPPALRRCRSCRRRRPLQDFDLEAPRQNAICLHCLPIAPAEALPQPNPRARTPDAAAEAFDAATQAQLARQGIRFLGVGWLQDSEGKHTIRGYMLNDNGTRRVRDYAGVLEMAMKLRDHA